MKNFKIPSADQLINPENKSELDFPEAGMSAIKRRKFLGMGLLGVPDLVYLLPIK
jgi:hypothetical protein